MIKVQEVVKGDNYYTMTFTDGLDAYGVLITFRDDKSFYLEFMEFAKNKQDILLVTEDEKPEEFKKLKEKYFDSIMEYIKKQAN